MTEQYEMLLNEYLPLDLVKKLKDDYIIVKIKILLDKIITEKPKIEDYEIFVDPIHTNTDDYDIIILNDNFIYYDNIIEFNVCPLSVFHSYISNNIKLNITNYYEYVDIKLNIQKKCEHNNINKIYIDIEKTNKIIKMTTNCHNIQKYNCKCLGCISSNCFNSIEEINEFMHMNIKEFVGDNDCISIMDDSDNKLIVIDETIDNKYFENDDDGYFYN